MIVLEQLKFFNFSEMRWTCSDITGPIDEYFKIDKNENLEYWSYLMLFEISKDFRICGDKECITFAIRHPGSTIGYIKCNGSGRIIDSEFYKSSCVDDDYSICEALENLKGQYIDLIELAKIEFVNDTNKINYKADQKILWFIANFLYLQSDNCNPHDKITNAIHNQFSNGYCLHFAIILKTLFKTGEICWAAPYGHMVYVQDNIAYDIDGISRSDCEYYIPISYIKKGIKDFTRVPGQFFDASEEYIQDAIERYKKDNNIIENKCMLFGQFKELDIYKYAKWVEICINGEPIIDINSIPDLDKLQVVGTGHKIDGNLLIDLIR